MSPTTNVYHHLGPKVTSVFLRSLEAEQILFDSKGRWLTFRAKRLKGRGIYANRMIKLSRGRLIVAKNRLVAIAAEWKIIDIPLDHPLFEKLTIDRSNPKRYTIRLDLGQISDELTGEVSLSYHINPLKDAIP